MKSILIVFLVIFLYQGLTPAEVIVDEIVIGRRFKVGADGSIYNSSGNHSINVYSPAGELTATIGKRGEGPGDIKRLGGFNVNPINGNIYVVEMYPGNKWISIFDKTGKYLGDWKCNLDWKKWSGLGSIEFDKSGYAYIEAIKRSQERRKNFTVGFYEQVLLKFSPKGRELKELYRLKVPVYAEGSGKGNITIPFQSYLSWDISSDRLIIGETINNYVEVYDLDGNLKKKIFLPFKKKTVTKKDKDDWEKKIRESKWGEKGIAQGWLDLKFWRNNLPFSEYRPTAFYQTRVDSHGHYYCMEFPGDKPIVYRWAKVDLSTAKVSIVTSSPKSWLLAMNSKGNFVLQYNEEGETTLVKLDGKDFFSESTDLKETGAR